MLRIIISGIIFFLCCYTEAQEIKNEVKINKFAFMAEIAKKFKPVAPYSQLYADFIKEKLKSENPEADDKMLATLSKMIVKPTNEMISLDIDLQKEDILIQYYNALSFMAGEQNTTAAKLLAKCLKKAPPLGYTRFFILQSLNKAKKNYKIRKQARSIFEKIILSHGVSSENAKVLYIITFDLGETFFINLAQKVKNLKQVDKWYRLILQGHAGVMLAWRSRGNGWYSTVTKEGWKGFHANLKNAERYLTEAWKTNPKHPEVAMIMIAVCMGQGSIDERIEWFKKSIGAQFDYYPAYREISNAIAPKWGGSNKLRLDLTVACFKYGGNNTNVAEYGIKILLNLAGRISNYRWQRAFLQKRVRKNLLQWASNKVRLAKSEDKKNEALALQILLDVYTLNYEQAKKNLEKLGTEVFDEEIEKLKKKKADPVISWLDPKALIMGFTGKNGKALRGIQKAFIYREKTDAMLNLFMLIRSGKLTEEEKSFAINFFAKMKIGKKANLYEFFGGSPLHVAIFYKSKPALIRSLLNLGIDCNVPTKKNQRTPLITAARYSDSLELIDILKEAGADLNQRDKYGWTALEHAIYKRNLSFAKRLIELGANVNTLDNSAKPLLLRAFLWRRNKAFEMLLKAGADINFQINGSRTLLINALCQNIDLSRLKELLKYKINLEQRCSYKGTALIYAAKFYRNPEGLKLLIAKGAKLDAADRDGDTSLISVAAWAKSPEKIKILLKAGANINKKNNAGRTPLIMSVISRRPLEEIKIFVEHSAKLNEIDNSGRTAYDWAVNKNNKDTVKYLSQQGAFPASKIKTKK